MDWKRMAPWNWFKDEQRSERALSVQPPRSELERWFDDAFARTFSRAFPAGPRLSPAEAGFPISLRPDVDISEGKKAYTVRAELPGVEREDVSIEVDGPTLAIRAEKRQETEEDDEGYHCVERSYGSIQRLLSLPDDADSEAIEAKFRNGVLKLRIPKHAARASSARSIEVQSG